jgi:primosomal protein N' (replication factor Y)
VPEALRGQIEAGMYVTVPFGKSDRQRTGVVIELTGRAEYPPEKQKEIIAISKSNVALPDDAIRLAAWMKKNYGGTMIAALKTVLPIKRSFQAKEKKTVRRLWDSADVQTALNEAAKKKQTAKARVLAELIHEEILPYELVTAKLHVAAATLKSLEKQGIIVCESVNYYRNPVKLEAASEERPTLTAAQQEVVASITAEYHRGVRATYLIHGITGSGKTEVYMRVIEDVVAAGKQCIFLIPEIALTYQTLLRFYKRFGDRVSVINSALSAGEKYDQHERAKRGDIDIIIGPRSALFVPFPNLGLIIVDEEHEPSYKSEQTPRYHARETAAALAELKGASLILGSATPSLAAYYRAKRGEYRLLELLWRVSEAVLPEVHIADLRAELRNGNREMFSYKLQELIATRLAEGEQIMLFLNRRGYAGFVSCRACGFVWKCPHCDVSLAKHQGGRMLCHYCGYETPELKNCPSCNSPYFRGFKAGTQQIEEALARLWPQARVLRMDGDTTKKKDSYDEILAAFANGRADILVGTQMIVKGHDFPNVTLVGIVAADMSLNVNDFRAGERTFQLLTQAAGRAGRGEKRGEVVIQTYSPEHYAVVHAANQDYGAFYAEEIEYREAMSYPPVAHMLAVLVNAADADKGMELARTLTDTVNGLLVSNNLPASRSIVKKRQIIGPAAAPIAKINDIYRYLFFIKHENYDILILCKDALEAELDEQRKRGGLSGVTVQFDFDPLGLG